MLNYIHTHAQVYTYTCMLKLYHGEPHIASMHLYNKLKYSTAHKILEAHNLDESFLH